MENYVSFKQPMPCPDGVYRLAELWPVDRPLYVVGGAVRDFMYSVYHRVPFLPNDYDLASQLNLDEIKVILRKADIPFTEVGAAFGIIEARLDDDYDVASFRSEWYDPDSGDGRHPNDVVQGVTPAEDASRRDLYINALFYNPITTEVRDYNGGKGLEDIANKKARMVGNPVHRFQEDRLRVCRLIRFFSRYNDGHLLDHIDNDTLMAIHKFKTLPGISAERKLAEFLDGIKQAMVPAMYIKNLSAVCETSDMHGSTGSVLHYMFPGVDICMDGLDDYEECRNPAVVLAWLLRGNEPKTLTSTKNGLGNRLKFPASLTDGIEFLIMLYQWAWDGFQADAAPRLVKRRDKFHRPDMTPVEKAALDDQMYMDTLEFNKFAGLPPLRLNHFMPYQSSLKAQQFIDKGLSGKELGHAILTEEAKRFQASWEQFQMENPGA